MEISIVVAAAENDVIGADQDIPWKLPDDQRRFKALTLGHPIIMGRLTHESIGRLLPGRQTIILSTEVQYHVDGATVVSSWTAALEAAAHDDSVFVVGGERIYQLALPESQQIYLTRVHAKIAGDTRFPSPAELEKVGFRCRETEHHPSDEKHSYAFSFERWSR